MTLIRTVSIPGLSTDSGILYMASRQIEKTSDNGFKATGDDPKLFFWIPLPRKRFTFKFDVATDILSGPVTVYWSHSIKPVFTEQQKLLLSEDRYPQGMFTVAFERPVHWIRIDPVDVPGDFKMKTLQISGKPNRVVTGEAPPYAQAVGLPGSKRVMRHIQASIQTGLWSPDSLMLLVTHEISGTGAPLLCRKISAHLLKKGMHCVILSLQAPSLLNYQETSHFLTDCDALLISPEQEVCHEQIRKLGQMGFRRVLLNTIVTGRVIHACRQSGMKTICLVHEMRSSIRILHAEELVRQIAANADNIVFPAERVMEDFISFGHPVNARCLVRTQGYYKDIVHTNKRDMRSELIKKWHLSANTQFIVGAGSINYGKGVDLLTLIAQDLRSRENGHMEYHFIWIGATNAPEYDIWVQDQIRRMGLTDRFHFTGYVGDEQVYMDYFSAACAYALVSREDSMPSVIIEAIASHIPVIAFRGSGGAEELLADGRGHLVDYMDLSAFANKIAHVCALENEEQTAEMTNKAAAVVRENLSFGRYVSYLMEVFAEIG